MTQPNVRRINGNANPDHPTYTGLGHVDRDGTYHFPDGKKLPATGGIIYPGDDHRTGGGQRLVVAEDASICGPPTPDAADLQWSGLQWLHCVDRARQDAYDVAEFGSVGGDPVPAVFDDEVGGLLPPTGADSGDPHGLGTYAHEVGSPERDAAVAQHRQASA